MPSESVVLSGTGLLTPEHVITNAELVTAFNAYVAHTNATHAEAIAKGERMPLIESSVEFIEKASGIKQRYVFDKSGVLDPHRMYPRFAPRSDEQLSFMAEIAVAAAQSALQQAGVGGDQVDAVYCASANMQRAYPAMAIEIQQALGAKGYAFDMNVACSSATFAIEQAVNAIRCGQARCVVVVNPEITSAHLDWMDRDCHFIFGDVCSAVVLQAASDVPHGVGWDVLGTRLATQFSNHIRNNFGFMNQAEDSDPKARDKKFKQEGRKVFKEVVPIAAEHIAHHVHDLGFTPAQIRRFWLHQANLGMNQLVIKRLRHQEVNDDLAPLILDEYANTASAGSIIAFHQHRADLQAGDVGVICSFGAGYSVGSVVVQKRA